MRKMYSISADSFWKFIDNGVFFGSFTMADGRLDTRTGKWNTTKKKLTEFCLQNDWKYRHYPELMFGYSYLTDEYCSTLEKSETLNNVAKSLLTCETETILLGTVCDDRRVYVDKKLANLTNAELIRIV